MPFYYLTLAAGLIVTVGFLFSRSKGAGVKNLFFKMASSLCFLLTAVFAVIAKPDISYYGVLIIMGGALGLCGDITLDLKFIYPKDNHGYLLSGFIFFAIGHIFIMLQLSGIISLNGGGCLSALRLPLQLQLQIRFQAKCWGLISVNTEILLCFILQFLRQQRLFQFLLHL